ncbi:S-adenosyl-L-methionine-dependent methyltransferase [Kockovaella imperatae]|uniref:S-adenosyl-L-methionine-dependent methyltransferase n=1 Tax=Kockovaella imperatae TaxID=4999 RepID=A0A1Y1UBM5_9TREE|nr:S-adenosyl-L-methionine-dependent methyltransferase [Kockovaella imperatae]ORX35448.1 S-adenosyl-L-methionine-dependent methyltransferase [Kockovaella imperatae]
MSGSNYSSSLSNHAAKQYTSQASFVYSKNYTAAIWDLLNPKEGEKIIDLGCGTGENTKRIKDAVGERGEVYGIDSSQDMLDKAGKDSSDVKWVQCDIQKISETLDPSLEGTFDAVFTSAVLHWCKDDPESVIRGISWLLKPGGRIAFEFGGFGNGAEVRTALHAVLKQRNVDPEPLDPWWFPTDTQYDQMLAQHGFKTSSIGLFPRPTPLASDLIGWLETFCRNTWFASFSKTEADELLEQVQDICRPSCYWKLDSPGQGRAKDEQAAISAGAGERGWGKTEGWSLMYIRLRGLATKT